MVQQAETRERIFYRNTNQKLATQLKNYRVAMSTLHDPDETEEWQNPSAHIADDPDVWGFIENEEEDENGEDNLGPVLPTLFYST